MTEVYASEGLTIEPIESPEGDLIDGVVIDFSNEFGLYLHLGLTFSIGAFTACPEP